MQKGEVKLEHGAVIQTGPSGVLELNTRGEFRLRSHPEQGPATFRSGRSTLSTSNQSLVIPGQENLVPGYSPMLMGYQNPAARYAAAISATRCPDSGAAPNLPGAPGPRSTTPSPQTPARDRAGSYYFCRAFNGTAMSVSVIVPGGGCRAAYARPCQGAFRQFTLTPRSGLDMEQKAITLPNGDHVAIFTGGINLVVKTADGKGLIRFRSRSHDHLDQG